MDRREMLRGWMAVAAGWMAATAMPSRALAADGDALTAGEVTAATTQTGVMLDDDSLAGMFLADDVHPDPDITHRAGVYGRTSRAGECESGVLGEGMDPGAVGVDGRNFWGGDGVRGYTRSGTGAGVVGRSEGDGPGVLADKPDGVALEVNGGASAEMDSATSVLHVENTHVHDGNGAACTAARATGFIGLRADATGEKTFDGPGRCPSGVVGTYLAPASEMAAGVGVQGDIFTATPTPENPFFSDKGIGVVGRSGGDFPEDFRIGWPQSSWGIGVAGAGSTTGVLATSEAGNALDARGKAVIASAHTPVLDVQYTGPDEFSEDAVTINAGRIRAGKEGSGATIYAESRGEPAFQAYCTGLGLHSRGEEGGVEGIATGVFGETNMVGVKGVIKTHDDLPKDTGVGVAGYSGILPYATEPNGCGVRGVGSAIGVRAESPSGKGLDVQGKAYFSTAGRATISKGRTSRTVSGVVLDPGSLVLATLQGSAGSGCYIRYVKKTSSTSFTIYLSKAASANVAVGWFIVN